MFSRRPTASKLCLVHLVRHMQERGFTLLDIQFVTDHLARFGAEEIPRQEYEERLQEALERRCSFAG